MILYLHGKTVVITMKVLIAIMHIAFYSKFSAKHLLVAAAEFLLTHLSPVFQFILPENLRNRQVF